MDDIQQLADGAAARLKRDLEALLIKLQAYLTARLDGAAVDENGRLVQDDANARLAAELGKQIAEVLTQLGYDDALHGLVSDFEVMAASTERAGFSLGAAYSTIDADTLSAFVNGTVDDMLALKGAAGEKLRDVMLAGAATNVTRQQALEDLASAMRGTFAQARTLADTSLMGFHRAILTHQSEGSGLDLFVYAGPDDAVCRPFCAAHVDRVYTTQDLDDDDNDQGLEPTSVYLGGYNCRHVLSPITVEEAQSMGAAEIGGIEARRIVLRGGEGANSAAFVSEKLGQVSGGKVIRRRRAA